MRKDEQLLIRKCREDNPNAQFEIYRRYYKAMFNTALRLVNQKEDAEDIMQESFLSAFRNIRSFNNEVSFGAWLRKIVINRSLDYLRKNKPIFTSLTETDILDHPSNTDTESLQLTIDKVRSGIKKLPDGYRVILTLHLIEGYDYEEISQILDIKISSVRSQFARAKAKLTDYLHHQ